MRRAAEIAQIEGYTYFAVLEERQSAKVGQITTPGQYHATTSYIGGTAYTSGFYTPGSTTSYEKPRTQMTIKLLAKAPVGEPGIYEAAQVLQYTANVLD